MGDAHDIGVEPGQPHRCASGRGTGWVLADDDRVGRAEKRRGGVERVEQRQDGRLQRHGERQAHPARLRAHPVERLRQRALVTLDGRVVPVEPELGISGRVHNR